MNGIGGNTKAFIQIKTVVSNELGEHVESWFDVQTLEGWLDLSSGDSKYTNFDAKIQESTHVFISNYVRLNEIISAENSRMVINGKRYDIMLIDNPMEMNQQIEIYLKFTGGQ